MGKIPLLFFWFNVPAFFYGRKKIVLLFFLCVQTLMLLAFSSEQTILAKNGQAQITILESPKPTPVQKFATEELAKYLKQISSAEFAVNPYQLKQGPAIRIELKNGKAKEAFSIIVRGTDIVLSGNSDRAILYAVYDFLNRLGCIWIAPDFDLYEGVAQYLQKDLRIQEQIAGGTDREIILQHISDLIDFLEANLDKSVFILTGQNDLARFTRKYGLTNQSLLD